MSENVEDKNIKGQTQQPALLLTGALGFEPRDGGTKTRCLTTWLRPNEPTLDNIAARLGVMSSTFRKYLPCTTAR